MDITIYVAGGLITVLLVIYRVRSSINEGRRKEAHTKVQTAIELSRKIEVLAIDYYQIAGDDPRCGPIGREIRNYFRLVGSVISDLHHQFQDRSLLSALTRFRKSATGELDSKFRRPVANNDEKIRQIEATCNSLCDCALSIFHSKFK